MTKNIQQQTLTEDISTKEEFIKILSLRSGFTQSDTRIFLDSLISIFEDAMIYRLELHISGWLQLTHTLIKSRIGSKPIKGKKGFSEKIELGESTRSNIKIAENLRKLSKSELPISEDE